MTTKNCPECSRDVNVRKLCCDCGHVFTLRRTKRFDIKCWKSEMQALNEKAGIKGTAQGGSNNIIAMATIFEISAQLVS